MIQRLQSHRLLVAADLQYGIRRGIDNQFSVFDLALCQLIEDLRSARRLIADDLSAGSFSSSSISSFGNPWSVNVTNGFVV